MKILQVVHNFFPNIVGGTQIYTDGLSKELAKRNDVHLFFSDHGIVKECFSKMGNYDGLPFTSLNPLTNSRRFQQLAPVGYFTGVNKKVDRVFKITLKQIKPDIIHFQHLFNLSTNLVNIAFQLGIPMIFTLHDYWLLCPRAHFMDNNQDICMITNNNFKCVKCLWNSLSLYRCKKIKITRLKTYIELPKNLIKLTLNSISLLYAIYYVFCFRPKAVQEIIKNLERK